MKLSKTETQEKIKEFFSDLGDKKEKDIKKMKRMAMSHNIKLKDLRKKFCKKCYSTKLKTLSVKNKIKRVKCLNCDYVARFKIKN